MAHKTFISYKYDESRELRDRIIKNLNDDAEYYRGENGFSDDLSSLKAETIKKKLADMIYDTSVTIVILSPHMKESKWIEWEINYSLRNTTRADRTSHRNGVVAVIKKVEGSYSWFKETDINCHGYSTIYYNNDMVPEIISRNHYNSKPPKWHCEKCRTFDAEFGSYIEYVDEESFLSSTQKYINRAFEKSKLYEDYYEVYVK